MKLTCREGVWYVDFKMPSGVRRRLTTNETDKAAAEKAAPSVIAAAIKLDGVKQSPGAVTPSLATLLERTYLSTWVHNESASYARLMVNRISREIGHWLGDEITHDRLKDYCLGMLRDGAKPATVNRRMSHISLALKEALSDGLLKSVPKIPRYKERNVKERYLTDAEEAGAMAWMDRKVQAEGFDPNGTGEWRYVRALIIFLIDSGCRLSEALASEPMVGSNGTKVHLKHGETKAGKSRANGKGARVIPLTRRAQAALKEMLASSFHTKVSVDWVGWRWLQVRQAPIDGIAIGDVNIHILRHTCASRLVQRGVSLYTVAKWLGHSSVTVTERYAHLAPDALDTAVHVLETGHPTPDVVQTLIEQLRANPGVMHPSVLKMVLNALQTPAQPVVPTGTQHLPQGRESLEGWHTGEGQVPDNQGDDGAKGGTRTLTGYPAGT